MSDKFQFVPLSVVVELREENERLREKLEGYKDVKNFISELREEACQYDIYENKQLKKYLKFCLDALIKHESDICNSDKFSECKDCVFRSISNSTQCKLKHYDEIIELLGEDDPDSDSAAVEEGEK